MTTDIHRQFRQHLPSLQGKDIRLVLDEWNYSWENLPQIYGEAGPRYPFKNALGIAVGLHEVFRHSDLLFMMNTHAVNVHGHVKTTQTEAVLRGDGAGMDAVPSPFRHAADHVQPGYRPARCVRRLDRRSPIPDRSCR